MAIVNEAEVIGQAPLEKGGRDDGYMDSECYELHHLMKSNVHSLMPKVLMGRIVIIKDKEGGVC